MKLDQAARYEHWVDHGLVGTAFILTFIVIALSLAK
jgi:hypothetical protein